MVMSCGFTSQICLIIALSFRADPGGLAFIIAKFHWHEALRFTHKSCAHVHVLKEKGGKRELVAAF